MTARFFFLMLLVAIPDPAFTQPAPSATPTDTVVGTVVSSRPRSLIIETDDGRHLVFTMDSTTDRPEKLAEGARASVRFVPSADEVRAATSVRLLGAKSAAQDPIPENIRRLERQIERNARRYRVGIRAGMGLDPELVSVGVHATLGPIFTPRLHVRPNLEIAYGELTSLVAVNLEAIYRLSQVRTGSAWAPYAGGGPTLGFSHRAFSVDDDRSFDFDDLDFNGGLNLLAGIEKPSGVFIELKSTVYANPHIRLLVGFTF